MKLFLREILLFQKYSYNISISIVTKAIEFHYFGLFANRMQSSSFIKPYSQEQVRPIMSTTERVESIKKRKKRTTSLTWTHSYEQSRKYRTMLHKNQHKVLNSIFPRTISHVYHGWRAHYTKHNDCYREVD